MIAQVRPYVLTAAAEQALKPFASFRECAKDCPEMIVIPAGEFTMGSPATEKGRSEEEGPQHKVIIVRTFAVAKFDVTFADWDACVSVGGCPQRSHLDGGQVTKPVIYVTWDQAQQYVAWLTRMTGQPYRLLTEAEWEYAARAGTTTAYYWGDEIGTGNANCDGCGSQRDNKEPTPVGSFAPNAFGLYDMAGNVWQWVEDCNHSDYGGAPTDGSAWISGECSSRIARGGSGYAGLENVRSATRAWESPGVGYDGLGFRVARTLLLPSR
jgi:formylglycine-generating enzyme required for sulfatase activity